MVYFHYSQPSKSLRINASSKTLNVNLKHVQSLVTLLLGRERERERGAVVSACSPANIGGPPEEPLVTEKVAHVFYRETCRPGTASTFTTRRPWDSTCPGSPAWTCSARMSRAPRGAPDGGRGASAWRARTPWPPGTASRGQSQLHTAKDLGETSIHAYLPAHTLELGN